MKNHRLRYSTAARPPRRRGVLVALAALCVAGALAPTTAAADTFSKPLSCIAEETTDAILCGTEIVADVALCGTEYVVDGSKCGFRYVTSAAECGTKHVVSASQCGVDYVTSGAQCGWQHVTDGAQCGWNYVRSGAQCGWNHLSSLFGLIRKPKSCNVPKSCDVAKSCNVPRGCDVARSCNVPNGCEIAKSCEVAATCDVDICRQTSPGAACLPGVADCDIKGFSCQPSFDSGVFRCMPDYFEASEIDRDFCEALYVPALADLANEAGTAMSYGAGASGSLGVTTSVETGTVYGPDGEYGCYVSTCAGAHTDIAIASYGVFGLFTDWSSFAGTSRVVSENVSTPVAELGFTTAQVFDAEFNDLIGTTNSLAIGFGILPAGVSVLSCSTSVTEVY